MRRSTLITATLLTLSLAPALKAQSWGIQVQHGGVGGYGQNYGERYSYPGAERMDRVSELAHAIDETASYIHEQFERNNRRPTWEERRAMEALHELNEAAAHFHDETESYAQNPRHTVRDFAQLEQTFYATERGLRGTPSRWYVDRGMEQIYVLMNELSRYYGRRSGYGHWGSSGRGSGHGGYDQGGRFGDDDQDGYADDENGYAPPPPYRR